MIFPGQHRNDIGDSGFLLLISMISIMISPQIAWKGDIHKELISRASNRYSTWIWIQFEIKKIKYLTEPNLFSVWDAEDQKDRIQIIRFKRLKGMTADVISLQISSLAIV